MRRLFVAVLTALLAMPWAGSSRRDPAALEALSAASRPQPAAVTTGTGLARMQREIAAREYQASPRGGAIQAPNRAQALRTWFEPTGVRVHDRTASGNAPLAELRLVGVGRGDLGLVEVTPGEVASEGSRVEIRRSGIVEWYVNAPAGLEQGFTLARRPAGAGPLVLELAVAGARAQLEGDTVVLSSAAGRQLRYGNLAVQDAAGAPHVARLEVPSASRVRLVIEDAGAAYPLVIDPLLTAEGFAATELAEYYQYSFGDGVAGAGDVNGDGYDDVIVGAPGYNLGQDVYGAAFVFLGSATGIADGDLSTAAAKLESNHGYSAFGQSVAGAGDVNGDGYDDVIVGASSYAANGIQGGAAFLFLGSATGIAGGDLSSAAARFESNQRYAFFGGSVAGAGDVNGDGYDDVIVGAPGYEGAIPGGAAFLFLGSAAGIAGGDLSTAAAKLESNLLYANLGESVAGVGDVNGDGYDDVIVGAPGGGAPGAENPGAAFLFLGSATGIADGDLSTAATTLESTQPFSTFGRSVAGAGDVNGDGYDDVIVGAPDLRDANEIPSGAAFLYLGSATGIADGDLSTAATRLESTLPREYLGSSVAGAGDVNSDGYDDVVVGASGSGYEYGVGYPGRAQFLFLGNAVGIANGDSSTAAVKLESNLLSVTFRIGAAGAGDVNGDGYDDVIVGAFFQYGGAAFLFLGNTCGNGADEDGDGLADYPADPGCATAADLTELGTAACDDGLDNDGDGRVDLSDSGCLDGADTSERGTAVCDDGLDNDGDGLSDYPPDPGCGDPDDASERGTAVCDDGLDNDGDGKADYPSDLGCSGPADLREDVRSFSDGASHLIAAASSSPDDAVVVAPRVGSCSFGCSLYSTHLRLSMGGTIGLDLTVVGPSSVEIAGGTVGGDVLADGVLYSSGFYGFGPSLVSLTSGSVAGSVRAVGTARVELLGGIVLGDVHFDSEEPDLHMSQLELAGTDIVGMVDLRGYAAAAISDGVIAGDLEAHDFTSIVVTGGYLLGNILALDTSVVEIHGAGFNLPTGNVTGSGGRITGTLEDGTPIDVGFLRAPGATIRLIPEPGALAGSLAASLALWLCAHRRGRANARSASAGA